MSTCFRLASPADADQINRIYAPFCTDSPVSFEVQPPSLEEMQARIVKVLRRYPWLVCEHDGEVLGYVYAGAFHERAAYVWSVTTTVYIRDDLRRSGVGAGLYTSLFQILRLQGFCNALAGISLPNPASIGLHRSLGFETAGIYRKIGYKTGSWHDVEWLQLKLNPAEDTEPRPPCWIGEAQQQPWWDEALNAGLHRVRL
jgi:phosphinothricin acetyltransferase